MIEGDHGSSERALAAGLTDADAFDTGIADLRRTAAADGVFCYTVFKGVGRTRAGRGRESEVHQP